MQAPFPSGLGGPGSHWLCLFIFLKYLKNEQQCFSSPQRIKQIVKGLKLKLGELRLLSGSQPGRHLTMIGDVLGCQDGRRGPISIHRVKTRDTAKHPTVRRTASHKRE